MDADDGPWLFVTERGAGGFGASRARALAALLRFHLNGWLFRCRWRASYHRQSLITVTLLETNGRPDVSGMQPALEAVGRRHGAIYVLDEAYRPVSQRAQPAALQPFAARRALSGTDLRTKAA